MQIVRVLIPRSGLSLLACAALLLGLAPSLRAQYQITTLGSAVTENFDTMVTNTGANATNNNLNVVNFSGALSTTTSAQRNTAWTINPGNANFTRSGAKGNASTGTNVSALGVYSAGNNATTTDRSLGFLGGGNGTTMNAVAQFTNASGSSIASLIIGYTGEQFQQQASLGSFISVSYSTTSATTGFTTIAGLNFNALVNAATASLNGDAAGNRTVFSTVTLAGLSIANGQSVWISFNYNRGTAGAGSAQGLAVDDITLTANAAAAALLWSGSSGDTWDTSTAKFSSGSVTWNNTSNSSTVAEFGTASQTITVGTITAGGVKFSASGVTLSGGALTDGSASGFSAEVTSGSDTATLSSTLSGSNGLTKIGSGTLVLGGTQSSLTGTVTVSGGTLQTSTSSLVNNNAITNNATVEFAQGSNGTYSGALANNGAFVKSGAGNLTISTAVTGSGSTSITGGTISAAANNNPIASGALSMSSGTTLDLNGHNASISGMTLAGATISNIGTLSVTGASALTATGTSTISGGTLALGSFTSSANRVFTTTGSVTISSAITSSSTGRLAKQGSGTLTLSGDNSGMTGIQLGVQGASPIEGGTLAANSDTALGASANQFQFNSGTLTSSSTRTFGNGLSIGGHDEVTVGIPTLSGSDMTFGGTVSFFRATGASTTALRLNANNNTTLSGLFAVTSGTGNFSGLTFGGSGSLTFAGSTSSTVTDAIAIKDTLTVKVTNSATGALGSGAITVNSGAKLDLRTSATLGNALVLNGGTLSLGLNGISQSLGTLNLTASSTIDLNSLASSALNFSDSHGITWSGTLTLANYNSSNNQVRFGTDATGLTGTQLALISASGVSGFALDGSGYLTAVPEPSTYAAILGGVALAGVIIRRKRTAKTTA